ncbi:Catalyzes methyl transfer from S-methylmethionine (SMM) to adenosyl-L-homocysteine (AdoMet) [Nowakowskiella sp. JEL0407]|nr:Catalyzes methyl transfer from S-methylmethionine (SMM) to adenosyl-L-homocysteine (AdoMet) [Nowakowskiella sp. JEL0407]
MFSEKPVYILDGALATFLEEHFHKDLNSNLWSSSVLASDPDSIKQTHLQYLNSNCDIITTSTYQSHLPHFLEKNYTKEESINLMHLGIQLAVEARDLHLKSHPEKKILVALSLGSFGAILANGSEFTGDFGNFTNSQIYEFHKSRLQLFTQSPLSNQIDILAFETIPSLREARIISTILNETYAFGNFSLFSHAPAWISFSCKDDVFCCGGDVFKECVEVVTDGCRRVVGVGVNCTNPVFVEKLVRDAKVVLDSKSRGDEVALICYPNSGEVWDNEKKQWVVVEKQKLISEFTRMAQLWVRAGAKIVGGCCRTTPEFISELSKTFNNS